MYGDAHLLGRHQPPWLLAVKTCFMLCYAMLCNAMSCHFHLLRCHPLLLRAQPREALARCERVHKHGEERLGAFGGHVAAARERSDHIRRERDGLNAIRRN